MSRNDDSIHHHPVINLSGKWWMRDVSYGYVEISYSCKSDSDLGGLWMIAVERAKKPKRNHSFVSAQVQFRRPSISLLQHAALAALGLFPLAVFADWLQDNDSELVPLIEAFEPPFEAARELAAIITTLRRPVHLVDGRA